MPTQQIAKTEVIPPKKAKREQHSFLIDAKKLSPLIKDIRDKLDDYVIGQEKAKDEVVNALSRTLAPNPKRKGTIANLMFLGPTGVGKTEVVRALYRILFNDPSIDIGECKIDCNSYVEAHETSDLVGAPPGYVGREQTPRLADKIIFKAFRKAKAEKRLHPILENFNDFGILLLDEVEKANPKFHDLFLGIMDEGYIELKIGLEEDKQGGTQRSSKGGTTEIDYHKTTYFRNVIIIMTSNIGAVEIQQKLEGKGRVGFSTEVQSQETILSEGFYKEIVKKTKEFKPEFLGRLTGFIPFNPLTKENFFKRLDLSVSQLESDFEDYKVKLLLTGRAKEHLVTEGLKSNEGGRKLVNMFDNEVKTLYLRSIFNNGEIERVENESGKKVVAINVDYQSGNYIVKARTDKKVKALTKRERHVAKMLSKKAKLLQQEALISLQEGSFLITLRDILVPHLKWYKALLEKKETLAEDYLLELKNTKEILEAFGLQEKDFELLTKEAIRNKYEEYENFFNEMGVLSSGILLWSESEKHTEFNGMLRPVEKYIRKYFEYNRDLKEMVRNNAGNIDDVIEPVMIFARKLLSRELKYSEESVILRILHREYLKLSPKAPAKTKVEDKVKESEEKAEQEKKEEQQKTKKSGSTSSALVPVQHITVNINIAADGSQKQDWKTKLQNLFQDKFELIMLAISQNLAKRTESDDIIDIMYKIKKELEGQLELSSNQTMAINDIVKEMLKEEEESSGLE